MGYRTKSKEQVGYLLLDLLRDTDQVLASSQARDIRGSDTRVCYSTDSVSPSPLTQPITRYLRYTHRPETRLLYSRRGVRTQRTTEASLCTNIHDTVCTQSSELSVYVLLSLPLLSSWCTPCCVSDSLGDFLSNLGAENERPVRRRGVELFCFQYIQTREDNHEDTLISRKSTPPTTVSLNLLSEELSIGQGEMSLTELQQYLPTHIEKHIRLLPH